MIDHSGESSLKVGIRLTSILKNVDRIQCKVHGQNRRNKTDGDISEINDRKEL